MLLLMTVMYVKKHRSLSPEEFAHVCMVYNRRAFFSEDLINDMYRVLDSRCEGFGISLVHTDS